MSEVQIKKRKSKEEKMIGVEELKFVEKVEGNPEKTMSIGTTMDSGLERELVYFLLKVFAWDVSDFQGIDLEVMVHRLNVDPAI